MCENSKISQCIYRNKTVTMIKSHISVKMISSTVKILQIFLNIYIGNIHHTGYPCSTTEIWYKR
jgi:hypothetical protein